MNVLLVQIPLIESDLRSLCLESRNKYPEIKTAAERAIIRLRNCNRQNESVCFAVLSSEYIIQPFLTACSSKHNKMIITSLSAIQKLLSIEGVSLKSYSSIIGSETNDESIIVKILQTLSLLLSPSSLLSISESSLSQALCICFRLLYHKTIIIKNTAFATLRQAFSIIFESASNSLIDMKENLDYLESGGFEKQSIEEILISSIKNLPESSIPAFYIFRDICFLNSGKKPIWLQITNENKGLELIEMTLSNFSKSFSNSSSFLLCFRDFLYPSLSHQIRLGARENVEILYLTRVIRVVIIFIKLCYTKIPKQCNNLLSILSRMMTSDSNIHILLVLDAFRLFSDDFDFWLFIFSNNTLFSSFLNGLKYIVNRHTFSFDNNWYLLIAKKYVLVDNNDENNLINNFFSSTSFNNNININSVPPYLSITIIIEILTNFVTLISTIVMNSTESNDISLNTKYNLYKSIVSSISEPLISIFTKTLETSTEEGAVEYLLKSFTSFCCNCGLLSLPSCRDSILSIICRFALPVTIICETNNSKSDVVSKNITLKNIQALRSLFNISQCLCGSLNTAWLQILECFETFDEYTQQYSHDSKSLSKEMIEEISILSSAMSRLFKQSTSMDETELIALLTSLGTLTLSSLANIATNNDTTSLVYYNTSIVEIPDIHIFALSNLMKTINFNLFRIEKIWEIAIAHIQCVINHKNHSIRSYGVTILTKFIINGLLFNDSQKKTNDNNNYFSESKQNLMLSPLVSLYSCKFDDTKKQILSSIFEILQSIGPSLSTGWNPILKILEITNQVTSSELISSAFRSLQLISNDFLEKFTVDSLKIFILDCFCFAQQQYDENISFAAIGVLWNVSNFLARVPIEFYNSSFEKKDNNLHWDLLNLSIFRSLRDISFDIRLNVRNSAVKTLLSIIDEIGGKMSEPGHDLWNPTLKSVLFPLLSHLLSFRGSDNTSNVELGRKTDGKSVMMILHHSRDSDAKQWDETRVFAMLGIANIIKSFLHAFNFNNNNVNILSELCNLLNIAIKNHSDEVGVSCISAISVILTSSFSKDNNKNSFWHLNKPIFSHFLNVFDSISYRYDAIYNEFTSKNKDIEFSTSLISNSINCIFTLIRCENLPIDMKDIEKLLKLISKWILLYQKVSTNHNILPMEKTVIEIFKYVFSKFCENTDSTDLISFIIMCLCSFITNRSPSIHTHWKNSNFSEIALNYLIEIFPKVSSLIQSNTFESVLTSLHTIFCQDELPRQSNLISLAMNAFSKLTAIGFASFYTLNHSNNNKNLTQSGKSLRIWACISDTLSDFLHLSADDNIHFTNVTDTKEEYQKTLLYQEQMLHLLVHSILPYSNKAPASVQWRLLGMFDIGWNGDNDSSSKLSLKSACINGLIELCSKNPLPDTIHPIIDSKSKRDVINSKTLLRFSNSTMAVSLLISRCEEIITYYIQDELKSKSGSLPSHRVDEIVYLLTSLISMQLHTQVVDTLNLDNPSKQIGTRLVLLKLYPMLCECVVLNNKKVKNLVKKALIEIGSEFGLI